MNLFYGHIRLVFCDIVHSVMELDYYLTGTDVFRQEIFYSAVLEPFDVHL